MTDAVQDHRTRFTSAARARGVAGAEIGEKVAEIESHVADSREDPEQTFGDEDQRHRARRGAVIPAGRGR